MSAVAAATPTRRTWTTARLIAWSLWAATLALSAVGAALVLVTLDAAVPDNWGFRGYSDIVAPIFSTAGLLIALRHPRNAIGWILLVGGFTNGFGGFAQEYATYAVLVRPGALPAAVQIAWLASWSFAFFAGPTIMLVPQLFPTGRPLTPRWAPLVWAPVLFILSAFVNFALRPGPLENASFIENPIVLSGTLADLRAALVAPLTLALLGATIASYAALVVRFRRARGVEQAQLKWMALSGSFLVVAFGGVAFGELEGSVWNTSKLAQIVMIAAFTTMPVAIGIAILRYRLYDIDVIIRRTLFYGALTAILTGVVAASIGLFQRLLIAITGEQSDAAVVLSTVVLVSAFTPIKNALQEFVDRRFKERPDPATRLAPYLGQLRAYLELQQPHALASRLLDELVAAVDATGGAIYLHEDGRAALVHRVGDEVVPTLTLPFATFGTLALGPRRGGNVYGESDREALRDALDVAAQALALSGGSHAG